MAADEDDESWASQDSDLERENAFSGRKVVWLKHTSDQRAVTAALNQAQANDLGIHLYNAHALKAMHYDKQEIGPLFRSWHSKQLWIQERADGTVPWTPPQSWTAWPMSSEDVPRLEEGHGNLDDMRGADPETITRNESWYPSIDLEDEILALLLRRAKEQLRAQNDEQQNRINAPVARKHDEPLTKSDITEETIASTATNIGTALRTGSSQTLQMIDDDDVAREVLLPDVRHIMTALDDLLLGLHQSRAGPERPVTSMKDEATFSTTKRKRSSTSAASTSQPAKKLHSNDTHVKKENGSVEKHMEQKHRTARPNQGVRDWSEVLGVAMLAGLDSEVVRRTAERCSALFGEGMTFDTSIERSIAHNKQVNVDMPFAARDTHITGYTCPYEGCPRSLQLIKRIDNFQTHLKRRHGLDDANVRQLIGEQYSAIAQQSAVQVEETEPSQDKYMKSITEELAIFGRRQA